MIKFENICTKKIFESGGTTKTKWLVCGTLRTIDDGRRFIELNHLPNVSFYVFEQKERGEREKREEINLEE